ncbi:MAG: cytochrome c peroxidase [Planctomycetota bacterium]
MSPRLSLLFLASIPSLITAGETSRHPVALVISADSSRIYVAQRDRGVISTLDPKSKSAGNELKVASDLTDLVRVGDFLIASSERSSRVTCLQEGDKGLTLRSSVSSPSAYRIASHSDLIAVSSRWKRSVSFLRLTKRDDADLREERRVSLDFPPGEILFLTKEKLLVFDAFGGNWAIVEGQKVHALKRLGVHNIAGASLSSNGTEVLVSCQRLTNADPKTAKSRSVAIEIENGYATVQIAELLSGSDAPNVTLRALDGPKFGAADPGSIAVTDDSVLIAIQGTGQLAIQRASGLELRDLRDLAGDVAVDPTKKLAYVALPFSDAISVVDLNSNAEPTMLSLYADAWDEEPLSLRSRGERFFRDARLSGTRRLTCHSCHTSGHTSEVLADTLTDRGYGNPKRTPSLEGVVNTGVWGWLGNVAHLDNQIRKSVQTTMSGEEPSYRIVNALVAFLASFETPPLVEPDDPNAVAGKEIFRRERCGKCHRAPDYTVPGRFDVGLRDEAGHRRFNPPSLRRVGHRQTFFHDGRARSLSDVLKRHAHPGETELSDSELSALISFLRSL